MFALCAATWFGVSCTSPAEHTNPLDPASPKYTTTGTVSGMVTSFYQPYEPLSGAAVKLLPAGTITEAGADGRYRFADLLPGDFTLLAAAPGYRPDTAVVKLKAREQLNFDFHLDAVPAVNSAAATSARVSTGDTSAERIFLQIEAELVDADGAGDISSVRVEAPGQLFSDTLAAGGRLGLWGRNFAPEELRGATTIQLVGIPLRLIVFDQPGARSISEPFFLVRVIREVPVAVYPAEGISIQDRSPQLRWQVPTPEFSHTLRVEIFKLDAGFPRFLTSIGKLAPGTVSTNYPGRLTAGTYFWTVKIIDDFGNSSRSKEAVFTVQ